MRKLLACFAFLSLMAFGLLPARADLVSALTVTSCGGLSLSSGTVHAVSQDLTGDLCTNAASGGSPTNVNITGPLGGLGVLDSAGVSFSMTGTVYTGFTTPCAGALGDVGIFTCMLYEMQQPLPGNNNANVVGAVVPPGVSAGNLVSGQTISMTGTASVAFSSGIAAPHNIGTAITSNRMYVTSLQCNNTSATATLVNFQDGSAGTTLWTVAAGATYSGEANSNGLPLFWTTAGNALYAANVTTGAAVVCSASGFYAP